MQFTVLRVSSLFIPPKPSSPVSHMGANSFPIFQHLMSETFLPITVHTQWLNLIGKCFLRPVPDLLDHEPTVLLGLLLLNSVLVYPSSNTHRATAGFNKANLIISCPCLQPHWIMVFTACRSEIFDDNHIESKKRDMEGCCGEVPM